MKTDFDIKKLLSAIDLPIDWVGLREVYEAHTPRMIRDGFPVANSKSSTHGVMVGGTSRWPVWLLWYP